MLRELEAACRECRQQRARVVFLRHDMLDAWDWPSDVARWYRLKTAPRFLFFVDVSGWPGGKGRGGLCWGSRAWAAAQWLWGHLEGMCWDEGRGRWPWRPGAPLASRLLTS